MVRVDGVDVVDSSFSYEVDEVDEDDSDVVAE